MRRLDPRAKRSRSDANLLEMVRQHQAARVVPHGVEDGLALLSGDGRWIEILEELPEAYALLHGRTSRLQPPPPRIGEARSALSL